ncbi:molybdate ABC transporter substrate-binding protein [Methylophaga sp.]|uniref:molybdate ABC transporter substrate-binding protein n=1 Tax=Methylophaga sp. TaxID=2024840 RepID=UPI003F6A102C
MHFKKLLLLILLFLPFQLNAAQLKVAVASNFSHVMAKLVHEFELQSAHEVILISGSTGKLYAQILNGAPFDAFFAADTFRPKQLELNHYIVSGSRFTYATGKIVLWSGDPDLIDSEAAILSSMSFRHLSIANPKLAPYGLAAQQFLQSKRLWQPLQEKIVRGENIGQAYHFIESGNAELGFVALAQIKQRMKLETGSFWMVPAELYQPIEQDAVRLTNKIGIKVFMDFIQSAKAKQIIRDYGYEVS